MMWTRMWKQQIFKKGAAVKGYRLTKEYTWHSTEYIKASIRSSTLHINYIKSTKELMKKNSTISAQEYC